MEFTLQGTEAKINIEDKTQANFLNLKLFIKTSQIKKLQHQSVNIIAL